MIRRQIGLATFVLIGGVASAAPEGAGCLTSFDVDFGTLFRPGSVCSLFPGTFADCDGDGPFLSSGSECGGVGDEVMVFGSGFPLSAATTRCIDVRASGADTLSFVYSKQDLTLGPAIEVSVAGGPFLELWTAPFSVGPGCHAESVDLGDIADETFVEFRFTADTSLSNEHAFDDLLLGVGASTLELTGPVPGAAGAINTLTVTGADPGAAITFVFGFTAGSFVVPGCAGVTVGMVPPQVLGTVVADGSGTAAISGFAPGTLSGTTILLQGVDQGGCEVTDLVTHTFP